MADPDPPSAPQTPLYCNKVSLPGLALVLVGLAGGVLVPLVSMIDEAPAYVGILVVFPALALILGVGLGLAGLLLTRRQLKRGNSTLLVSRFFLDLTRRAHRGAMGVAVVAAAAVVTGITIGSFETFHVLESNSFCGDTCHSVMHPEAMAHTHSPHARVDCVACHVGNGVGGFMESKLGGSRRMMALLSGDFARPIPTPVLDMSPARDVCEHCHWKERFVDYQELTRVYVSADDKNTVTRLRLLVKVGGMDASLMKGAGIHYHMLAVRKIEYTAADRRRQQIGWMRVTAADGTVTEFEHERFKPTAEEKQRLPIRSMDCLDCHNRPAHRFLAPTEAVNAALGGGVLPVELPRIKARAVMALDGDYKTDDEAMAGIAQGVREYYESEYADLVTAQPQLVRQAVLGLQQIYRDNFFPAMAVKWSAYPDNIGHLNSAGCFRCHTDEMVSAEGKAVFSTCNKCHLILAQGADVSRADTVDFAEGMTFVHPGDGDTYTDFVLCAECHSGGKDLY